MADIALLAERLRDIAASEHVEPAKLVGQNLGYAYSNLPTFRALLVSKKVVETEHFDLVIDTRGWAATLSLPTTRIFDANALN